MIFEYPLKSSAINHLTGEVYFLSSCENVDALNDSDIQKMVEICNQSAVYNFLFSHKFDGRKYSNGDAIGYLKMAADGWINQTGFVFIIRNSRDEFVGVIHLMSNNFNSAEIGYWADKRSKGIMSNAVAKIIELAKSAGYKSLFAATKTNNVRSMNVLTRNGFVGGERITDYGSPRNKFTKTLL